MIMVDLMHLMAVYWCWKGYWTEFGKLKGQKMKYMMYQFASQKESDCAKNCYFYDHEIKKKSTSSIIFSSSIFEIRSWKSVKCEKKKKFLSRLFNAIKSN